MRKACISTGTVVSCAISTVRVAAAVTAASSTNTAVPRISAASTSRTFAGRSMPNTATAATAATATWIQATPSPAVTPTNLLYNVVATPGALYRYWRQGPTGGRLALVLIAGTVPGVIAGSVIRGELQPGPRVFDLVVAAVLLPLGIWLALTRPAPEDEPGRPARLIPAPVLIAKQTGLASGCGWWHGRCS